MNLRVVFTLTVACLCIILSACVSAEQVPVTPTEIRQESEDVQWVPHSVTVVTKETLETTYRRDLEDIESLVPGLIVDRMNRTPRGAAIALRGLGSSGAAKSFDPAVAVNVDGVYVGTHTNRLQVLFDFEKIEVVRSPHTFEANPNISGSINIERTKPTGELDVDVRASVGIDERREMDVVFNFPIVESLNGKFAMYWKDRGGDYMTNVFSERDENTEDYYIASLTLDWSFRDLLTATYTFDNENSDEATPAILNISAPTDLLCANTTGTPFPNCRRGFKNPELDSLRTTSQNFSNIREYEGNHHTLRLEFEGGGHEFLAITGYRDTDEAMDLDLDASNSSFYHLQQEQQYEQFSQSLTMKGARGDNLDYTTGLYILDTAYNLFQQEYHILKQLGDAGFAPGQAAGAIQELSSSQDSLLLSAFAHAKYQLNDQWIADLGLRWSQVERDFEHIPSRIRLGNALSPIRTQLVGEETSKELLMSTGISYKVDEEAMIYFRYTEGFLPGGFDENAMSAASGNSYGAETSRTGEIGLKSDWWDDRLRINVVYYKTELDNKVERFDAYVANGVIESLLDNVAEVEIAGWEVEIESTPMQNLYLRTSYSHINSDYNQFNVADLQNPGGIVNLSNLDPARAPAENLYFSADYSLPLGPGVLSAFAGYRLFSDYQTYPVLPEGDVKNWSAWDLSVSYEYREWLFRLFSNNVKNKEFAQNAGQITQTDILPVEGSTVVPSLNTFTEYNQPRYTGIEIVYRPSF